MATQNIQDVPSTEQNTDRVIQVHKDAKELHGDILETTKNVLHGARHLRDVNSQPINNKLALGNKEAVKEFVELNNDSIELLPLLKDTGDLQLENHHLEKHYQELEQTQQLMDKLNQCQNLFKDLCIELKKRSKPNLLPANSPDIVVTETTISSVNSSELDFSRKLPSSSPYANLRD